jgi:type II secretory pathway component PulK
VTAVVVIAVVVMVVIAVVVIAVVVMVVIAAAMGMGDRIFSKIVQKRAGPIIQKGKWMAVI